MTEDYIKKIGGRKYALVILIFILTTALLIFIKIEKESFATVVQLILVVYPAGAISQTYILGKIKQSTELDIDLSTDLVYDKRKFNLVALIYLTVVGLTFFKYIDGTIYVNVTNWLITLYIAGNVAEKAIQGISDK